MATALTFFLTAGVLLTLPCVVLYAVFYKDFFELAFPAKPPSLRESTALSNAFVFYYVTRVFLICLAGLLVVYVANIVRSLL